MKVSVNANDLNRMLKTASKLVDLTGLLAGKLALSVHDGIFEVIVVTLNGQTTELRLSVAAGGVYNDDFERVPAESGFCVVRAKDLAPIKNAVKGSEIVIGAQKDIVHVATPGFAFDIQTAHDPTEFPCPVELPGDPAASLEIAPDDCGCFKFIVPALSLDTSRPEFTGAVLRDGALISTDGHRLHHCPLPALFGTGELVGIISPGVLKFIADGHAGTLTEYREQKEVEVPGCLKRCKGGKTEMQTVATWHVLEAPGFCIKSGPISGSFPDFRRVFPNYKLDETAEVDAKTLSNAIKPLYAGWKIDLCMVIRCNPDGTEFSCTGKPGPKSGDLPPRTAVLNDTKLPHLPVALNPSFIMDALNGASDQVTFCCAGEDSPVWIGERSPMAPGRGALIMPMRTLTPRGILPRHYMA